MVGAAAAAPPTPPAHRLIVDLVASEASPSRLLAIMRSVGLIPVTVHGSSNIGGTVVGFLRESWRNRRWDPRRAAGLIGTTL